MNNDNEKRKKEKKSGFVSDSGPYMSGPGPFKTNASNIFVLS